MKATLRRKLYMSIGAAVMTACCLTTTTYAWFARNTEAWVESDTFKIDRYDGMSISIDGVNYMQSIDNDTLKKAIVAKLLGKELDKESDRTLIYSMTSEELDAEYEKLSLLDVTTKDLKTFQSLDVDTLDSTKKYYQLKAAENTSYVQFDLYFRITEFGNSDTNTYDDYELSFISTEWFNNANSSKTPVSYITGKDTDVIVNSKFTVDGKEYKPGDKIKMNAANAMRIGVLNEKESIDPIIYEPNAGWGSYAIEGETEKKYNPDCSPMLQYLNAYAKYELAPLSGDTAAYKNTEKNFDGNKKLGTFHATNGKYNDIKLTVSVWLEGYDADYIAGCDLKDINCYLSFYKKEVTKK